jgi:hypothetical protein
MNPIDRIEVAARSDHRMGNGVAVADTGMPNFAAETLPNAFKVMCIDLDCNAVTRVYPGGVPGKLCASEKDKKLA